MTTANQIEQRDPFLQMIVSVWTPELISLLRSRPLRFGELKQKIPGISSKVLTARLRSLQEKGIVHRDVLPSSPPHTLYSLTHFGAKVSSVLGLLGKLKDETE